MSTHIFSSEFIFVNFSAQKEKVTLLQCIANSELVRSFIAICSEFAVMNSEPKIPGYKERIETLIGTEKPFSWAARIGIPAATFNRMWNDGVSPKGDILLLISERTGCSIDWLLTGKEPMKRGEGSQVAQGNGFVQGQEVRAKEIHIDVHNGGGATVTEDHDVYKPDLTARAFLEEWLSLTGPAQMRVWGYLREEMEKERKKKEG